jgi:oligopeptide/dipeptide ABC transporter ATP-binding protein
MFESGESDLVLGVENLSVSYRTLRGLLKAVDGVSLKLFSGKIHALVGESGCGKSTLGLALSRLLPESKVVYSGRIVYKGQDILSLKESEVEKIRGTEIATTFQEPMTSLDPVYKIGEQVAEAISVRIQRRPEENRTGLSGNVFGAATISKVYKRGLYVRHHEEVNQLLTRVRISTPERIANLYPHELSGGMKQRVMIAMALAERPSLLVADEPTTALDVTTQSQVLSLLANISRELGMTTLIVTHDLGVVSAVSDYVSVMYAGKIIEEAPTRKLFANPHHPYTVGLMNSFPKGRKGESKLTTIPGSVPPLGKYPSGCRFNPRCPKAFATCTNKVPKLVEYQGEHKVACFLYSEASSNE